MPKGTSASNSIIALIYNAVTWPNIAQNASTSPITDIHIALHTASLTGASTQLSNETSYPNYARRPVPRSTLGWTAPTAGATQNVAAVEFPQSGPVNTTITTASAGKSLSGAGETFHYGDLNDPILISNQIQPRFPPGAITITES